MPVAVLTRFICVISFNPHNSVVGSIMFSNFTNEDPVI